MILIIAEKPSLARNIVAGIGSNLQKRNGWFEGNGYIVTWAFGHLFSLCDIEDYTGPTSTNRWSMENIPCFPKEFKFRLTEKEFEEMRELAEQEGRTMSNLLRYLVAKERKEREK